MRQQPIASLRGEEGRAGDGGEVGRLGEPRACGMACELKTTYIYALVGNLSRWYVDISDREAVIKGYDLMKSGEKIPKV